MNRRKVLKLMGMSGVTWCVSSLPYLSLTDTPMLTRPIPSTGEKLPAVGLGTWIQFDVPPSSPERQSLKAVLNNMAREGGKVIDSSPMYGLSEQSIGDLAREQGDPDRFFYATKVWTRGKNEGIQQMESSMRKMRRTTIDLMQVHNLVDWKTHLDTLANWKREGRIRYMGITHYTDGHHDELADIVASHKPDFVQFNYSIRNRHAEKKLLDVAKHHGVAVIINQPFESGSLFNVVKAKTLPPWSKEYGIEYWAQFMLKYLISHPSVTCVIPGTSDPAHVVQNMEAAKGILPDDKTRRQMAQVFERI